MPSGSAHPREDSGYRGNSAGRGGRSGVGGRRAVGAGWLSPRGRALMANICVTGVCNRACSYCFAGMNVSGSARAVSYMTWETYLQALDYAQRSKTDHVRILGGEPTLHPEFNAMVAEALARNLTVRVFSNGLMPERAVEFLQTVPPGKAIVLLRSAERRAGKE